MFHGAYEVLTKLFDALEDQIAFTRAWRARFELVGESWCFLVMS